MQSSWEWLLALEASGGLENAKSFCSLARHLTDALSRNELGLVHLTNLLQSSAQPPIEALLTTCEVLLNEWVLDNIKPIQQPAPELSRAFLQGLAGDEAALQLAQQLLFTMGSGPRTLYSSTSHQDISRRLQSSSNTNAAVQRSSLPLSNINGQRVSADAASVRPALQMYTLKDPVSDRVWPFMGRPILSDPIFGPMLQPREVSRGSVVVGGMLLNQRRILPPSSQQYNQLCSSRFASLVTNCTSVFPVQLESTVVASQQKDSEILLERGGISWFPMWQLKQQGSADEESADDLAPFGADSAYNPHSTLFSPTALLQKDIFYDLRNSSNEIAAGEKPYGFFSQQTDSPQDSFAVVFPVHSCLPSSQCITLACFHARDSSCALRNTATLDLFCTEAQHVHQLSVLSYLLKTCV